MDDPKPKLSKHFAKVEFSVFELTCRELQLSPSELANALGYTDSVASNWRSDGKIPKVAAIACEALRRRQGKSELNYVLVKTETKAQFDTILTFCKALGVECVNL